MNSEKFKYILRTVFLIIIAISLFITACKKDFGKPKWEVDLTSPLINTSLTTSDIIPNKILSSDANGLITLVFSDTLYKLQIDSIIAAPDTIISEAFIWPIYYNAPPGFELFNATESKTMNLDDAKIEYIGFHSGFLELEATNSIERNILFSFAMPSATLNGIPFILNAIIPSESNGETGIYKQNHNVSGYTLNMRGESGDAINTILYHSSAIIDSNTASINLIPGDRTAINVNFKDIIIEKARGYFGSGRFISEEKDIDFSILPELESGNIQLENIDVNIEICNGLGIDASISITEFTATNTTTDKTSSLNGTSLINISRALETSNTHAPVSSTQLTVDLSQTNIKDLIQLLPDKISYSTEIITNPMGNISSGNDFLYHNNSLSAVLNASIPLSFSASDITFTKTLPFSIQQENSNAIKSGEIIAIIQNELPLSIKIQAYFYSSNSSLLDSLFTSPARIQGALTDSINQNQSISTSEIMINLNEEKLNNIISATQIKIVSVIETTEQKNIQLFTHNSININLGGRFNYIVNNNKEND